MNQTQQKKKKPTQAQNCSKPMPFWAFTLSIVFFFAFSYPSLLKAQNDDKRLMDSLSVAIQEMMQNMGNPAFDQILNESSRQGSGDSTLKNIPLTTYFSTKGSISPDTAYTNPLTQKLDLFYQSTDYLIKTQLASSSDNALKEAQDLIDRQKCIAIVVTGAETGTVSGNVANGFRANGSKGATVAVAFSSDLQSSLFKPETFAFLTKRLLALEKLTSEEIKPEDYLFLTLEGAADLMARALSPDLPPHNLTPFIGTHLKDEAGWFSDEEAQKIEQFLAQPRKWQAPISIITSDGFEDENAYDLSTAIRINYYSTPFAPAEPPTLESSIETGLSAEDEMLLEKDLHKGKYTEAIERLIQTQHVNAQMSIMIGGIILMAGLLLNFFVAWGVAANGTNAGCAFWWTPLLGIIIGFIGLVFIGTSNPSNGIYYGAMAGTFLLPFLFSFAGLKLGSK
ncbi:hypothetical protein [Hugenholtzia roseola]|uniref:hypothetical protein n=1 Tax=Hugenholtzia roseola TaxID=1002 RepID=UPI001B7F8CFD|nr:hypothetical protein [Hugenholtzia roseola]